MPLFKLRTAAGTFCSPLAVRGILRPEICRLAMHGWSTQTAQGVGLHMSAVAPACLQPDCAQTQACPAARWPCGAFCMARSAVLRCMGGRPRQLRGVVCLHMQEHQHAPNQMAHRGRRLAQPALMLHMVNHSAVQVFQVFILYHAMLSLLSHMGTMEPSSARA